MVVNETNTQTIIDNLRAEGQNSRAEYVELMQLRMTELLAQLDEFSNASTRTAELERFIRWAMENGATENDFKNALNN